MVGGDFNAHHSNWGSSQNNFRGDEIANFLAQTDLIVLNKGSKPTFQRAHLSSVIDVTLASNYLSTKINDWQVLSNFNNSYKTRV